MAVTISLDDVELVAEAHKLEPGDIFVVRVPVGYSQSDAAKWDEELQRRIPEGVTLMLLPPGYDIEVYRASQVVDGDDNRS